MSSAVNLMNAVNVEGPVGAIRRNRVEMSVVRFMTVSLLKFLGLLYVSVFKVYWLVRKA